MECQHISILIVLVATFLVSRTAAQLTGPLNCSDTSRVCSAFLHYLLPDDQNIKDVESMFNVWPEDITMENGPMYTPSAPNQQSLFIKVTCSCSSSSDGSSTSQYNYQLHPTTSVPSTKYQGLEWTASNALDSTWLLCGCSSNMYPYLLSYTVANGDILSTLSSRFNSNASDIAKLNNIQNNSFIGDGAVYYIPLTTVPGVSVNLAAAAPTVEQGSTQSKSKFSLATIIGVAGGGAVLLMAAIGVIYLKANATGNVHTTGRSDLKLLQCFNGRKEPLIRSSQHPTISRELLSGAVGKDKPQTFSYDEIASATDNFKDTNKVGQGAFGSVYHGILREQDIAVKRMKATKTKEFLAELKVLCNVNHSNLVEIVGYASSEDELFLVYEYAENKSLSDRLHEPLFKGYTPLSWITRVQIALDAARGLEYIHDHTKAHYVHRDVKTSNILLDANFRAKIADFGLAKLVEQTDDGNQPATRIVGTFGYLAPEYLRGGHATPKIDVYAFGVVLFELITGQEAISRSRVFVPSTPERRSLITIMLSALRDATPVNINKLRDVVDSSLEGMYPTDGLYRVAILGKQCVEEDPVLRPTMKQIVFTLSQVVFNSIEWEATLAGNSQIFSSIMLGR